MDTKDAGKKGGIKTLKKYGKSHFKRISQLGNAVLKQRRAEKAKNE